MEEKIRDKQSVTETKLTRKARKEHDLLKDGIITKFLKFIHDYLGCIIITILTPVILYIIYMLGVYFHDTERAVLLAHFKNVMKSFWESLVIFIGGWYARNLKKPKVEK